MLLLLLLLKPVHLSQKSGATSKLLKAFFPLAFTEFSHHIDFLELFLENVTLRREDLPGSIVDG